MTYTFGGDGIGRLGGRALFTRFAMACRKVNTFIASLEIN